jgi:hypothetical protein
MPAMPSIGQALPAWGRSVSFGLNLKEIRSQRDSFTVVR